ncbi:MAG: TIGR02466 family protein [Steroidobacteraceae bacterium]
MSLHALFPTRIHAARLLRAADHPLNMRLLRECRQLAADDVAGQRWSARNYPGGYTSYASVARMQQMSPVFAQLERRIDRHVRSFAAELEFDLGDRKLAMTDCWVNVMPRGVTHSLHLHPLSVVSGTYYVRTPRGAPGLKFEDPRLDRYMGAPPRHPQARQENCQWVTLPAVAGQLLLFESWLRHEVPPNPVAGERISISFNYGWL